MVMATLAAFTVLALVLGRLTPPSTASAEESTTTTAQLATPVTQFDRAKWTISEIETSEQIAWDQVTVIETWPIGLFEGDDQLLLFGSSTAPFEPGDRYGLDLWASEDGLSWSPKGNVVSPDVSVHQVARSEPGFVASGTLEDGSPVLFTSRDGFEWASLDIPSSELGEGPVIFRINHVSNDMMILSQIQRYRDHRFIEDALPEEWQSNDVEWSVFGSGDDPTIVVSGPLGIVAAEFTPEELGLSSDDMAAYTTGFSEPSETTLWIGDEEGWTTSTLDAHDVSTVHVLPDGRLLATGHSSSGPAVWVSTDGQSWTRQGAISELRNLSETSRPWRDGIITQDPTSSSPDLLYTSDFENWESLGVADLLPDVLTWWIYPIVADDDGIVVMAQTAFPESSTASLPEPAFIETGEFSLTLSQSSGSLSLDRAGEHILSVRTWSQKPAQEITALDFERRTLTILDPDTNQQLVVFGFDELLRLEHEAFSHVPTGNPTALLYSPDGEEWLVQESDPVNIAGMLILEDRLVAAAIGPWYPDYGNPPETTIWVGTIP